ncbi:hypothetical protein JW872_03035 [Candidatus Babeliales bacterium]|nr:hypothetical protein [Candidatus Babeliales bacterium]
MKIKYLVMMTGLFVVRSASAGHFLTKVMACFHVLLLSLGSGAGLSKTRPMFPSKFPVEISGIMAREMEMDRASLEIGERTYDEYMRLCRGNEIPAYDVSLVEPENPYGERAWYCQQLSEAMRLDTAKSTVMRERQFSGKVATDAWTLRRWLLKRADYQGFGSEVSYRDSQHISGVLLRLFLDDVEGKFSDWSDRDEQTLERLGLVVRTPEHGVPVFTERFEVLKKNFKEVLCGKRTEQTGCMAPLIEMVLTQSRSGANSDRLDALRNYVMSEEKTHS